MSHEKGVFSRFLVFGYAVGVNFLDFDSNFEIHEKIKFKTSKFEGNGGAEQPPVDQEFEDFKSMGVPDLEAKRRQLLKSLEKHKGARTITIENDYHKKKEFAPKKEDKKKPVPLAKPKNPVELPLIVPRLVEEPAEDPPPPAATATAPPPQQVAQTSHQITKPTPPPTLKPPIVLPILPIPLPKADIQPQVTVLDILNQFLI